MNQDNTKLNASYWEQRWKNRETRWDIGYASPPIVSYMQHYTDKDAAILIPGCGNAHEAAWLVDQGYNNVTILDISATAIANAKQKISNRDSLQFVCADFFDFEGTFDLILEQTFFCALPIERRHAYAQKMVELLKNSGKLVGVLFDRKFESAGPPYGGDLEEYRSIFAPYFILNRFEGCYNSIPSRAGTELFINMAKI